MLNELKESTDWQFDKIRKTVHDQDETIGKEIETMKKNQWEILEMKTKTELKKKKKSLEGLKIRLAQAKKRKKKMFGELKDSTFKITEA